MRKHEVIGEVTLDALVPHLHPGASQTQLTARGFGDLVRAHLSIARIDHWVKNVFVLPGILVALTIGQVFEWDVLIGRLAVGLIAVGLIASSNYVINEVLDGPFDRSHPVKRNRPVPSGRVNIPLAYVEWLALMAAGLALSLMISGPFALTMAALWVMGCVYNIPPARTKDVPYLDVLSEAVNNPLRMLAGWYIAAATVPPPVSLMVSYWMVGCYFMAIKRYAEYREIGAAARATYRRSFAGYSEQTLLVSIMFYGAFAMLMFGAFIMRYRLELILSFPLVALVMAVYFHLSFKADSAVQRPEGLYREPALMAAVTACSVLIGALLFVDVPALHSIFAPTPFGLPPIGD